MTVRATNLQNSLAGTPSEDHRLIRAFWNPSSTTGLHGYSGVLPGPPGFLGEVTLLGPESVRINPGRWIVPGTQAATQGDYLVVNDAPVERAIGARDATLTRLDRVVVRVRDTMYTPNEGVDDADVIVVPGAPALTGAALPALPANSLHLGQLTVPPGSGTVTFTPVVVPQQVAVGGIQPTRAGETMPSAGYAGHFRDHHTLGLQRATGVGAGASWGPVTIDRLRLANVADAGLASTGHAFQIGPDTGSNLIADADEIMSRNNGAASFVSINVEPDGNGRHGSVSIGPSAVFHGGNLDDAGHLYQSLAIARLRLTATNDAAALNPDGTGTAPSAYHALQVGPNDGNHWIADANEIIPRQANGRLGTLWISGLSVAEPTADAHPVTRRYHTGPTVRVRRATAVAVPNGTWIAITWSINDHDTDGMWSSGPNVICRRAGYYLVAAGFSLGPAATGRRGVRVMRNGAVTTIGRLSPPCATASGDVGVEATGVFYFDVDDTIQVQCFQDSGASVNTGTTDFSYPSLSMMWQRV